MVDEVILNKSSPDIPFRIGQFVLAGAGLATIVGSFAAVSQTADLSTHFKFFYLLAALLAAVLFGFRRKWRWLVISALVFAIHLPGIATWYIPAPTAADTVGTPLRVVTANVFTFNRDYDAFLDFIRDSDPDIIFLQEIDDAWAEGLEPLKEEYPHFEMEPRSDFFGIALFSRHPLTDSEVRHLPEARVPVIHARLTLGATTTSLLSVHTRPPRGAAWTTMRNLQLEWIADYVNEQDGPVIMAGDFNITPWSPHYKAMIRQASLVSSRKGHGIVATWPRFPLPLLPLDHILTTPDIQTLSFRRGPDLGSDHRLLVADLLLSS